MEKATHLFAQEQLYLGEDWASRLARSDKDALRICTVSVEPIQEMGLE